MKPGSLLPAFALLASAGAAAAAETKVGSPPLSTGRFIVQFSDEGSAKFRKRDGTPSTSGFFKLLEDKGTQVSPALEFTSDIFHGASFVLPQNASIDIINKMPEVKNVWPAGTFTLPMMDGAVAANGSYPKWSVHSSTGVEKLHDLGYFGAGVTVGIVDTGVDYTHEALGGGFGPGFLVEGGTDLVGDNYTPGGTTVPDDDPMDCAGHGTHVSGILAGKSHDGLFVGVAPDVKIRMYKVFGCGDSTTEDVIVQGFLAAYADGVDVVTASLGSDQGFAETALATVATMIQASGTFVSIANGNSGANGPFYTSSGANGFGSMGVGSVEAPVYVGFYANATSTSGEKRQIAYLDSSARQWQLNGTFDASFIPDELTHNSCQDGFLAIPSDQILVYPRGNCAWQNLDSSAVGKANYIFYWNFNGSGYEIPSRQLYRPEQAKGFALISYEDGMWLVDQDLAGNNVTFTFSIAGDDAVGIPMTNGNGGAMNDFSSWGPTLDGRMKPEVAAPGGVILSTWPVASGSWYTASGTSMATPYIAGVASLYLSVKGGKSKFGIEAGNLAHNAIVASGMFMHNADGSGNFSSVAHQGAGLVDAFKAVTYKSMVTPSNLNLNDTDHFNGVQTFVITNDGADEVTYNLTHGPGVSFLTSGNPVYWVNQVPPYYTGEGFQADVTIEPSVVTVPAGGKATVTLRFTEPSQMDPILLPVYGGGVYVDGDNGESLKVTYMGIKGSLYNAPTWTDNMPAFYSPYGGSPKDNDTYNLHQAFAPHASFVMLWGTREFSFDLVAEDWQLSDWVYPPVAGENKWAGSLMNHRQLGDTGYDYFPIKDYPRNEGAFDMHWGANFTTGVPIPDGRYKFLSRALKTFGDKQNISDWQIRVSPVFVNDNSLPVTASA